MKDIGAGDLITIKTNNGQFQTISGTSYESLNGDSMELLRSVKADTVEAFISTHQSWVASDN
jgi:hypothetical protein